MSSVEKEEKRPSTDLDIFNDVERDTVDVLGERSTNPID